MIKTAKKIFRWLICIAVFSWWIYIVIANWGIRSYILE